MRTGNGIGHAGVVVQIGHLDLAQQLDSVLGQQLGVDDASILKYTLLKAYAAQQTALFALGGMVFKVLAQVALGTCFGNGVTNGG